MPLTVLQRRAHWSEADTGWVCDGCGWDHEEALCLWETGRVTRSDPKGEKVVCLCDYCEERYPHGKFVDG